MADNTWIANAQGVAYAANKHMLALFNATSSARYIRVYKALLLNNNTSAVTGVLNTARIYSLTTSMSGGTAVTPISMVSANSALDANTTAGHNVSTTLGSILRQLLHSPDEPVVTTLDWDSIGCLIPFATWWDTGYGDANVQPFTMAPSENRGFSIYSVTQTVGTADLEILFTDKAS